MFPKVASSYAKSQAGCVDKNLYRTRFGTLIQKNCLKMMEAAGDCSAASASTLQKFDRWISDAFDSVAGYCGSQFTELKPWVKEWVDQMRNTTLTCSSKVSGGPKGLNLAMGFSAYNLEKDALVGVDPGGGFTSEIRSGHPIIAIGSEVIDVLRRDSPVSPDHYLQVVETLVHEGFHSTHANNQPDHNHIQRTYFDKNKPSDYWKCGDNLLIDRVTVLGAVCSKQEIMGIGTPKTMPHRNSGAEEVWNRTAGCGFERGCVNLFSDNSDEHSEDLWDAGTTIYLPSKGLSKLGAAALCQKVVTVGQCSAKRNHFVDTSTAAFELEAVSKTPEQDEDASELDHG